MYSSPIAFPLFETIDSLSPSGSVANPISALSLKTFCSNSFKFSAKGSASLVKLPSPLQFIVITSHPNCSQSIGKINDPAPFTASMTTLNFFFRMLSVSIHFAAKTFSMCSSFAVE